MISNSHTHTPSRRQRLTTWHLERTKTTQRLRIPKAVAKCTLTHAFDHTHVRKETKKNCQAWFRELLLKLMLPLSFHYLFFVITSAVVCWICIYLWLVISMMMSSDLWIFIAAEIKNDVHDSVERTLKSILVKQLCVFGSIRSIRISRSCSMHVENRRRVYFVSEYFCPQIRAVFLFFFLTNVLSHHRMCDFVLLSLNVFIEAERKMCYEFV